MALIDDLVARVTEPELRSQLQRAVNELRKRRKFGLVFEEHIPETTALFGVPVVPGATVQLRQDGGDGPLFTVRELSASGKRAVIVGDDKRERTVSVRSLLVVKRFGEPMYAALEPIEAVRGTAPERAHHTVINGENFHALQLLAYAFPKAVDCIYIDPPYNTGARDWKYNNRFVDNNDGWRHSKWLAMMHRRLEIARSLLKPDGVLICTVDEHEVHHLGMLLEDLFPKYLRYMVTIVHNPKGTYKNNFARVEEYAMFCCPGIGREVINPLPEGLYIQAERPEQLESALAADFEYLYLRRRGQESGYRPQRPNQFYAIIVDEAKKEVIGVGPALGRNDPYEVTKRGTRITVYPIDTRGQERVWRYNRETMIDLINKGEIVVTGYSTRTRTWVLNHRRPRRETKRVKTVWWERRHDAGGHGSDLLTEYLGKPGLFPFPKSVYAVRDCLDAVVRNRPDALILDFFAGSGTTLHATCLLNEADGGTRRCVLVTNNEVEDTLARSLMKKRHYPGDRQYEKHGVFESVAKPRLRALIRGKRPDGKGIKGEHVWHGRRPYAQGFPENIEFFRLRYLDPNEVELGDQFEAVAPALWLAAGGIGERSLPDLPVDFFISKNAPYAVLFRTGRLLKFLAALEKRPDVTHVWIVTDSDEAFAEACESLPPHIKRISQLYRDYLRSFRVNVRLT